MTRSGPRSSMAASASVAVAGRFDVVAARAQQRDQRPLNGDLVVDEQDAGARRHAVLRRRDAAGRAAAATAIVNCAPPSGRFSAQIRPSSAASRPRAMPSPMPVPIECRRASRPR